METFEIHITGDESVHDRAKSLNLKTITVDLLRPDRSVLRSEHMTSQILKFDNLASCKEFVFDTAKKLGPVLRTKIECPYYKHYKDDSLYIESHFLSDDFDFPTSQNSKKKINLGTVREYYKDSYDAFIIAWKEVELCVYDSYIEEDKDWFNLYENISKQKRDG